MRKQNETEHKVELNQRNYSRHSTWQVDMFSTIQFRLNEPAVIVDVLIIVRCNSTFVEFCITPNRVRGGTLATTITQRYFDYVVTFSILQRLIQMISVALKVLDLKK